MDGFCIVVEFKQGRFCTKGASPSSYCILSFLLFLHILSKKDYKKTRYLQKQIKTNHSKNRIRMKMIQMCGIQSRNKSNSRSRQKSRSHYIKGKQISPPGWQGSARDMSVMYGLKYLSYNVEKNTRRGRSSRSRSRVNQY